MPRKGAASALAALGALLLWPLPRDIGAQSARENPAAAAEYLRRLEAALLLQTLNAELLSHDSASVTLQRWCSIHQLASPAQITADRARNAVSPPPEDVRQRLRVTPSDEVRYRRVSLRCGTVLLSQADNWYVPARLTPQMNQLLESGDTPFGLAVQSLHFQRHTISAEMLWQPLPAGWEMSPSAGTPDAGGLCLPGELLRHRALLTLPDGTPFSEVVETYTSSVLAVPRLAALHPC